MFSGSTLPGYLELKPDIMRVVAEYDNVKHFLCLWVIRQEYDSCRIYFL